MNHETPGKIPPGSFAFQIPQRMVTIAASSRFGVMALPGATTSLPWLARSAARPSRCLCVDVTRECRHPAEYRVVPPSAPPRAPSHQAGRLHAEWKDPRQRGSRRREHTAYPAQRARRGPPRPGCGEAPRLQSLQLSVTSVSGICRIRSTPICPNRTSPCSPTRSLDHLMQGRVSPGGRRSADPGGANRTLAPRRGRSIGSSAHPGPG